MERVRVLIADSQRLFSESLATSLQKDPELAVFPELPTSGLGCLKLAVARRPDVVVADHWLHGLQGSMLVSSLRRQVPTCRIVVLAWLCTNAQLEAVTRRGAEAIGRDAPLWELHATILDLARREAGHQVEISAMTPPLDTLTPRELEVLEVVHLGVNPAASALSVSPKTIQTYVHRICAKLDVRSQAEAVALARRYGAVHPMPLSNDALAAVGQGPAGTGGSAAIERQKVLAGIDSELEAVAGVKRSPSDAIAPNRTIRLLVADSQRLFADALAQALRARAGWIEVFDHHPVSGPEVLDAIEDLRPDVALVDYWSPELDGPTITQQVTADVPGVAMILTSWVHGPDDVRRSLAAGAAGFLPKGMSLDRALEAIAQAAAGHPLALGAELAGFIDQMERVTSEVATTTHRFEGLTTRELEVLRLLGEGLSYKQISVALTIDHTTVKSHVHAMLKKSRARTASQLVAAARFCGVL